jgi:CHAT domain-containing protein
LLEAVVDAGVPVVVGNRWPVVDDEDSVNLVVEFYRKLLSGFPPERALWWARRVVRQSHPSWASAVMIDQRHQGH